MLNSYGLVPNDLVSLLRGRGLIRRFSSTF
jgi:hypothetical protein